MVTAVNEWPCIIRPADHDEQSVLLNEVFISTKVYENIFPINILLANLIN